MNLEIGEVGDMAGIQVDRRGKTGKIVTALVVKGQAEGGERAGVIGEMKHQRVAEERLRGRKKEAVMFGKPGQRK
jgi:hypothetical protein